MFWIFLSIFAALLYAIITFFDNYITDVVYANRKPMAMKVINGISYLLAATFIVSFYQNFQSPTLSVALLLVFAGIITSLASIPYYLGLKNEEATGVTIYYQLQPVMYLLAGLIFFHDSVSIGQLVALALLISGPLLIIFARRRKKSRRQALSTAALFVFHIAIVVASGLIFVKSSTGYDYLSCFTFFLFGRGIADAILVTIKKDWRQDFQAVWQKDKALVLKTVGVSQIFTLLVEYVNRRALSEGNPSLVSAIVNALELILVFVLGIILSLKWPEIGREKLSRHIVLAHVAAVILCVAGIIVINFA